MKTTAPRGRPAPLRRPDRERHGIAGLVLAGYLFNLGLWADKLLYFFWAWREPGAGLRERVQTALGHGLPMLLACLAMVPGVAVLLSYLEAEFARRHAAFYGAVRAGTLEAIDEAGRALGASVRERLQEIGRIQGITMVLLLLGGPGVLELLHAPPRVRLLFYIDAAAASLGVLLLAALQLLGCLEQRALALRLGLLLLAANTALTPTARSLLPAVPGLGCAAAMALCSGLALRLLLRRLRHLEYETFMLRRQAPRLFPWRPA